MTALADARSALWRAAECDRSMMRMHYLYRAADALDRAGLPRWAERAHSAALRIGGDDRDMQLLLLEIDCALKSRTGHVVKIRTDFWAKPIPLRQFDWIAIDEDTYDGAPDSHSPIGYGATEAEAVADLLEQIEERAA